MQVRRWLWVAAAFLTVGCGGQRGAEPARAGEKSVPGTTAADWQGRSDSGLPAWVGRGSAAVQTDAGRVFYGVGAAGGIKNPALLRTTADNRGRAEIAKLFEVFSASLMKDYMASTGEQQVEQAVKTMSSMALEGVEVIDRYIAGDGTLYALVALRLETVAAAVKEAKARGVVKSHGVDKLSLDDIFDRHAKKPAVESAPRIVAQGEAPAAEKGPASGGEENVKTRKGGAEPAWVKGEDSAYPRRTFLCAVGYASERAAAENGAFAALARIFEARVASVTTDFMGAYSKTGAQQLETQSVESLTQVSTAKLLSGVELREMWQAKDKMLYALACMERARAAAGLREQIASADGRADKAFAEAAVADRASKVRHLGRALDALVERQALNGELRIVDADGVGVPGALSHVDVAAALESAVQALRVGVQAEGAYEGDFRGALVEALTRRGYQVSEVDGASDGPLDVLIAATVRVEDAGAGSGGAAALHFARGVVQIELKNVATGKSIGAFNESRKEGHRSKDEAERRVVRQLGKTLSDKVGAKIDAAMKGR